MKKQKPLILNEELISDEELARKLQAEENKNLPKVKQTPISTTSSNIIFSDEILARKLFIDDKRDNKISSHLENNDNLEQPNGLTEDELLAIKLQKELEMEVEPEPKPPSPPHFDLPSYDDLDDLLARQLQKEEDEKQNTAIRRQAYKYRNGYGVDITRPTVSSAARTVPPISRRPVTVQRGIGETYEDLLRLDDTIKKRGLSSQKFNTFPVINWTKTTQEACNCVICLEDFKTSDKVVIMPCCLTKFHIVCAQKALADSRSCPFCRKELEE